MTDQCHARGACNPPQGASGVSVAGLIQQGTKYSEAFFMLQGCLCHASDGHVLQPLFLSFYLVLISTDGEDGWSCCAIIQCWDGVKQWAEIAESLVEIVREWRTLRPYRGRMTAPGLKTAAVVGCPARHTRGGRPLGCSTVGPKERRPSLSPSFSYHTRTQRARDSLGANILVRGENCAGPRCKEKKVQGGCCWVECSILMEQAALQ